MKDYVLARSAGGNPIQIWIRSDANRGLAHIDAWSPHTGGNRRLLDADLSLRALDMLARTADDVHAFVTGTAPYQIADGLARAWANYRAAHPPCPAQWGVYDILDEARAIADRWTYPDRVHLVVEDASNWLLVLSTGGWSENEEIVDSVSVIFRSISWIASRRGGHHAFGMGKLGDAAWSALRVPLPEETT